MRVGIRRIERAFVSMEQNPRENISIDDLAYNHNADCRSLANQQVAFALHNLKLRLWLAAIVLFRFAMQSYSSIRFPLKPQ